MMMTHNVVSNHNLTVRHQLHHKYPKRRRNSLYKYYCIFLQELHRLVLYEEYHFLYFQIAENRINSNLNQFLFIHTNFCIVFQSRLRSPNVKPYSLLNKCSISSRSIASKSPSLMRCSTQNTHI
jgi:hypothetical protein